MATNLSLLLDFTKFTHEIRNVKRSMWVKDGEVLENDSEHSFQLAMIAMYIIQENKLPLELDCTLLPINGVKSLDLQYLQ